MKTDRKEKEKGGYKESHKEKQYMSAVRQDKRSQSEGMNRELALKLLGVTGLVGGIIRMKNAELICSVTHCNDWKKIGLCKNYNHQPSLWMRIPEKCRIMLVSQAPSRSASNKQILADNRNKIFVDIYKNILRISEGEFHKYIYWTHYAKCYPGPAKGGDAIPTVYCANKYLQDEYDLCKPKFVLGVGRCASIYLYSNFLDKDIAKTKIKFKEIRNKTHLRDGVTFVFITHPSPTAKKTEEDKKFIKEVLPGLIQKAIEM